MPSRRSAALSLGRLGAAQGRRADARLSLAAVSDRFTEGFETSDLQATTGLLAEFA